MSKISIEGNALGSGTFTIASPNSNTNYTLGLPEEAGTITTSNSPYSTFRNRIINGDCRIAQRGTSAVTGSGDYPVDRFTMQNTTDGAFSAQQDSSAPTGFVNSVKITTTTADTNLTTTQNLAFIQRIEGTNIADLAWGSAGAKTITVSFWVRSSLTGTFGGALRNSDNDRSYPFTYTISVADTWEYKTVTIAGDTSGTWLTTNGVGIAVLFGLGVGPDRSGTAGAWAGANYVSATGAVSVIGTLNATWYVTGVQLEVGSVATPFERRPYGTELQLCLRYAFVATSDVLTTVFGTGATTAYSQIVLPVQMRASPTPTISGSLFVTANGASGGDITATSPTVSANGLSNIGGRMSIAGFNSALTNNSIYGGSSQGASGKITFSAEL